MANKPKEFLLKYGVPSLSILVVCIQIIMMNTKRLNAWKGGGYGMYSDIHYYYNQIYIPGMVVDSIIKDDPSMKDPLGRLLLMPNKNTLKTAAERILETSGKDSIEIQVWKPIIDLESGKYSRALVDEIHLNYSDL